MLEYDQQLEEEAKTWLIEDEKKRHEKYQRERIRHPKLIKDLLLDKLATHRMHIVEVGGGPEPVSDFFQFKSRVVIDPLAEEYKKYFPCPDHFGIKIEDFKLANSATIDLVICTNALDHVENPFEAISNMNDLLKPGGFMAIMCAENNALTNPHPCHVHNLTVDFIHQQLDWAYETVWELTFEKDNYRYGWVKYQDKVGQPAFAILLRKVIGY